MSAHDDLTVAWQEWGDSTLLAKWRKANPGEAAKLDAYRGGGPLPDLATPVGRALVRETSAWLATKPTAPPPPAGTLDVFRQTVYPGPYITPYPGGEKHAWHWLVFKQPTLETFLPASTNEADMGTIRWEPGGLYQGSRETWVISSCRFVEGTPGRFLDFHQHGSDEPRGFNYCNTRVPPSSCGLAPVALDWWGGSAGMTLTVQPGEDDYSWPNTRQAVTEQKMAELADGWIDTVTHLRWGRKDDGSGAGFARTFVNGELAIAFPPYHTYWLGEGMVTLWQGIYKNVGTTSTLVMESTPYRVGRTYAEALAQRPVVAGAGWGSRGQDGRNAHAVKVGTRPLSDVKLPAL